MDKPKHSDLDACAEAKDWILARTVAVFFRMPGGNPVMRGSGVLFRIANVAFVLSASHVLKFASEADLLLAPMVNMSRFVNVNEGLVVFTSDQHDVDVGVIRLPENAAELLAQQKQFLRLSELDARIELPQGRHFVAGYPLQLNKIDHSAKEARIGSFGYWTHLDFSNRGGKRGVSISCAFTSPTAWDLRNEAHRMPDLGGVSGCGIWRLWTSERYGLLHNWNTDWIRLVGIEHGVVATKEIRGTLIQHVVRLIAENFPDLRAAIALTEVA